MGNMDSSTYRHLMGQIKDSCKIPHYNFPSHNLLCLETLNEISGDLNNPDEIMLEKDFLCSFPCYKSFDYNVEFSAPLFCGSGMTDVALNLINRKLRWEKKLKNIKIVNTKKARQDLKKFKSGEISKISKKLSSLINHFQKDPAPNFSGNYNWLYTGGNLVCKKLNNHIILLSANYEKAGYNVLKLNDEMDEVENKTTYTLKTNSPIFQIFANVDHDSIIALFRQKRSVNAYKISDINISSSSKKLWSKKVNEDKFLTYCCINEDGKTVILAESTGGVHVYNLNDSKKIYKYSEKKILKNKWTQIILKDSTIYLADRNAFFTIDMRDFTGHPILLYNPLNNTNNCEDICSITYCENNSNYVYLGTTHSIIQVDLRKKKSIQKWTHLMKSPPQFMGCVEDYNNDLLILQSPHIGETVGITNEHIKKEDSFNYLSKSPPCALNSIKKSLKFSRLNGLCLNPFVTERFNFTVTGFQIVKNNDGKINFFTTNSGGDIFFSKITKEKLELSDNYLSKTKILESMKIYENHFEENLPLKLAKKQKYMVNMSTIIQDFKNLKVSEVKRKISKFYWKYNEMFTQDSLKMYKDVLAQKILKVWGISIENEDKYDTDVDIDDIIKNSTDKVKEWMAKIKLTLCSLSFFLTGPGNFNTYLKKMNKLNTNICQLVQIKKNIPEHVWNGYSNWEQNKKELAGNLVKHIIFLKLAKFC